MGRKVIDLEDIEHPLVICMSSRVNIHIDTLCCGDNMHTNAFHIQWDQMLLRIDQLNNCYIW